MLSCEFECPLSLQLETAYNRQRLYLIQLLIFISEPVFFLFFRCAEYWWNSSWMMVKWKRLLIKQNYKTYIIIHNIHSCMYLFLLEKGTDVWCFLVWCVYHLMHCAVSSPTLSHTLTYRLWRISQNMLSLTSLFNIGPLVKQPSISSISSVFSSTYILHSIWYHCHAKRVGLC